MADYLLVHDRLTFHHLRPPLARAWLSRSFSPCHPLAGYWLPAALDFAHHSHVSLDDLLLPRLNSLSFDRSLWRTLVGELLLITACEIPEFPPHLESLTHLLTLHHPLAPVHQLLHGAHDLTFGLATYRPGHAGLNDVDDVARLAEFLTSVKPEDWTVDDLNNLPDLDAEDRGEELAFAREWFASLTQLYHRVHHAHPQRILVFETVW